MSVCSVLLQSLQVSCAPGVAWFGDMYLGKEGLSSPDPVTQFEPNMSTNITFRSLDGLRQNVLPPNNNATYLNPGAHPCKLPKQQMHKKTRLNMSVSKAG